MHINGVAKTSWTDSGPETRLNIRSDGNQKNFTAEEEYFSHSLYLGAPPIDEGFVLPSGAHTFDFSIDLPENLPSSFEGNFKNLFGLIKDLYRVTSI